MEAALHFCDVGAADQAVANQLTRDTVCTPTLESRQHIGSPWRPAMSAVLGSGSLKTMHVHKCGGALKRLVG